MIYTVTNRWEFADRWDKLEDCLKIFEADKSVACDTETAGLSFIDHELYTIQIGNADNQVVIDVKSLDEAQWKELIKFLGSKELILHNAVFDLPFLYNKGLISVTVYDTYLSEYVLTMGIRDIRRSLADVAQRYLDVKIEKEQRNSIIENGMQSMEDVQYAAIDVKYLLQIKEAQTRQINKFKLDKAVRLENEFVKVLAYIEYCGIYIDRDKWYEHVRLAEYLEYGAKLKLKETAIEYGINEDVNWASPKQMVEVMHKIGISTFDEKENKHTVDSGFLRKQKHPLIDVYLDYKEKSKVVTTYGRNWFDYIRHDHRIHSKFKSMVDTARTSSGNVSAGPFPNMQNLSKESDTRECFCGQRGNVLVIGDYSSQESVLMADFSREPALLEFFKTGGGDMHSYVAKQIYYDKIGDISLAEVKDKFPDLRTKAKAAGFAIQYGGNGKTISDNMNIPHEDGIRLYEEYMGKFPKLQEYFDKTYNDNLARGYILTNSVTNRKRFVKGLPEMAKLFDNKPFWEKYREEKKKNSAWYLDKRERLKKVWALKSEVYKLGLNTPIQSTAADMSKLGGVMFLKWIIENKLFGKVKIVNFVHDEYVVECNQKSAEKIAVALKECMENAASYFTKLLKIKVDPVISKYWKK